MAYFDSLFASSSAKTSSPSVSSGGGYFSDLKFSEPKKKTTSNISPIVSTSKKMTIGGLTFDTKPAQSSSAQLVNIYKALTTPRKPTNLDTSAGLHFDFKPEQKKLNDQQLSQAKAITLPNGQTLQPSVIRSATKEEIEASKPKKNIFSLARKFIDSLFGISPEERARLDLNDEIATSQNAYFLKKNFPELSEPFSLSDLTKPGGNPFRESPAEQVGREAMKELGIYTQPTNKGFTDIMFALSLPVSLGAGAAGLAPGILSQLLALGKFTAVTVAFDAAMEKLTGKHSLSELLPENTPMPIQIATDGLQFLGEAVLSHGIKPGKLLDAFTKETINKYKLPEKVSLDSKAVNDIVNNGKMTTSEQKRAFKDLGLTDKQIETALKNGVEIQLPSQNVVKVVDRPYWADIKKSFRVEPITGEKVAPTAKINVRPTTSTEVPFANVETAGRNITVYRGAKSSAIDTTRENGITGGVSFSTDRAVAQRFATREGGTVSRYTIDPNAKIINHSSLEKLNAKDVPQFLKDNKIDVVRFDLPKGAKGEAELRVINDKVLRTTPAPPKPKPVAEGKTPSKIAKSIERKAIEEELTKGFENLAGYDKITIKDQAARAARVLKDIERTRRIIRGEEPLPEGLRGTALIAATEARIKATGDGKLAYELANSPLVSRTSLAAQELRLAAERVPDSLTVRMRELKDLREASIKKRTGKSVDESVKLEVKKIKAETQKKNPTKQDWSSFIKSIEC